MTTAAAPQTQPAKAGPGTAGQAAFHVEALRDGLPFGATVKGLGLADLDRPEVRSTLYDLWIDKGVILFRACEDSAKMHIELSRCFGELGRQFFKSTWVDGHPELTNIRYEPENGTCYDIGGELIGGYLPWHSDAAYSDTINRGGILRPIHLSQAGGRTGFIDQIAAYDSLPEDLKARIDKLHVVYVMDLNVVNSKFMRPNEITFVRGAKSTMTNSRREYTYPRILHPMVYEQAETGRKVLNISPWFAQGVYELGGPEGDALLRDLISRCTDESQSYFHDWRMGDMLLWDNWRAIHCGTGVPAHERRLLHRTTISGDYALGRKLDGGGEPPKFDV